MIKTNVHSYHESHIVIKISGERVLDYLQGQITQDINKLTPQNAIYTAVLTPQGKMVSDFILMHGQSDEIIILCPTSSADKLVHRLRQFMLGYQLRLGIVSRMGILSLQGDKVDNLLEHLGFPHPDVLDLSLRTQDNMMLLRKAEGSTQGIWLIAEQTELATLIKDNHWGEHVDESMLESARISHGISRFGMDWDAATFPLNANLIESEGVCFEKGCYVGQEVTSRMFWRKSMKKRLYHVKLSALPSSLPCPVSTTAAIGTLTSAANHDGEIFGIAHLSISSVESGKSLSFDEHQSLHILGLAHA